MVKSWAIASTMNGNQGKRVNACVSAAGKWPDHEWLSIFGNIIEVDHHGVIHKIALKVDHPDPHREYTSWRVSWTMGTIWYATRRITVRE